MCHPVYDSGFICKKTKQNGEYMCVIFGVEHQLNSLFKHNVLKGEAMFENCDLNQFATLYLINILTSSHVEIFE